MENIQLNYTHRDLYASITPCMKRLRAFQKTNFKAGESQTGNVYD